MAFSFENIEHGVVHKGRKVIIYGREKVGKSPLAASAPNSLLIKTEDRVDHIDCAKTPLITTMEQMIEVLRYVSEDDHKFETIIIDTVDELEPMLHKYLCNKVGARHILDEKNSQTNFHNGLKVLAPNGWRDFLLMLDRIRLKRKVNIIMVMHAVVQSVNLPDTEPYDRYSMKIEKNSLPILMGWADIIGFYHKKILFTHEEIGKDETRAIPVIEDDNRWLEVSGNSESYNAGNSYGLNDMFVPKNKLAETMQYLLNANNFIKKNDEV